MSSKFFKQLNTLKSVTPRKEWRASARDFLMLQCKQQPLKNLGWLGSFRLVTSQLLNIQWSALFTHRLVVVPLTVFMIVIVGVGVTANVAKSSLPGDALYPIKLVSERVQISLTWQGKDRSKLKAEFATRRLDEISTLVKQPNVKKEHVEQAIADFKDKVASAKDDLAQAKEEGSVHDVVEVAKILDSQTQEYEKKLGEVKKDLAPGTKQELTATMNAALDAVEEVSVNSLTTLVEQADKDGVTKEEVKQIIQTRIDSVKQEVELPKGSSTSENRQLKSASSAPSVPSATSAQIEQKTLEVKSYLAEDDLTKALGAITETKVLVRKQEKEVDTSRGSSTSESSKETNPNILKPNNLEPKIDDHTIVDKKDQEKNDDSALSAPSAGSANNTDAPGAIIIEEK